MFRNYLRRVYRLLLPLVFGRSQFKLFLGAALQVRAGKRAAVVVLQDGADGHEELGMSRTEMMNLRNEESRQAAAAIGLETPGFLNYARLAENIQPAAVRSEE